MKTVFIFLSLSFIVSFGVSAQSASYFGRFAGGVGINQNTLERASAIGYNAKVSVNDALVLGDTSLVKVGIGLSNPKYRLDVKGLFNVSMAYNSPVYKINDRNFLELDEKGQFVLNSFKMKYENVNQWSDRVFEKTYKLMPLPEVAEFINQHHHLPNVPSAQEVVEKGIKVDEMVSKLLEKVEELTLHSINQQNEIEMLKAEISKLKTKK